VGTSVGFAHDVARLYAYGPKDISWNRDGRLELWYLNPYEATAIHRSRPTSHLADSLLSAEVLLGTEQGSGGMAELALDPDGSHGIVILRSRADVTLFTLGPDQLLTKIPLIDASSGKDVELKTLRGVVYAHGRYFLGLSQERDQFAIARLDPAGFTFLTRLPVGDAAARFHSLVRTTDGQLGVAMEGDAGLFVYPLAADGELGQPWVVPHRSRRPESCAPEAFGYIVDLEPPLTPYLETIEEEPIKVAGLRAKMLVYPGGSCIEAMSARVRAVPATAPAPKSAHAVPLVLQNADSKGGRLSLSCQ
jgi:hypothetical protein